MLRVGQAEVDAVSAVIRSGKLFRYREPGAVGECQRFEQRYGCYLDVPHVTMAASGTAALTAGLAGLGIGPGDEVIVPAHTYMATAVAVLAVGAIPVIVDIDESIMLSPAALDDAVGRRTRAVIPVHMWGHPCDMDAIMRIARKRKLKVIEDACQGVGGGYEGRKLGSIGHVGAFSFNFFKNMTCGEGGAVVTRDDRVAQVARCMVDCCGFFWTGKARDVQTFAANGSRASEIEGAMMNAQLDRIAGLLRALRKSKQRILRAVRGVPGLQPNPLHSPQYECATNIFLMLPTAAKAATFAAEVGGGVAGKTGRHTFNEWDPILNHRSSHHPALNPYLLPANRLCRRNYPANLCRRSLEILNRTVMIGNTLDRTDRDIEALIAKIKTAAGHVAA